MMIKFNYSTEHDDRGSGDNTRRVSFKGGNRISKHNRNHNPTIVRLDLLNDDIDMGGALVAASSSGRGGR